MSRTRHLGRLGLVAMAAGLAACSLYTGGECGAEVRVSLYVDQAEPWSRPEGVMVSGPATFLTPRSLEADDGTLASFTYRLPGDDVVTFEPGQRVWAEVWARGPFWVNGRLSLFTLDENGGPGTLLLAVWEGENGTAEARGWTVAYQDGDCTVSDPLCGPALGSDMRVSAPGGGSALVAPGTSIVLDGYQVSNGASLRFESRPLCSDTPRTWSRGGLVRLPPA